MPASEREQHRVKGVTPRPSGTSVPDAPRPFSLERAEALVARLEAIATGEATVEDSQAAAEASRLLPAFKSGLTALAGGALSEHETQALADQQTVLENLEGVALKGRRHSVLYRPERPIQIAGELLERARGESGPEATTKINTGWILDQHLFDPDAAKDWPTLYYDYRHFDAGRNDMAMGHSVYYPDTSSMFGWVWQVQGFYWTDTTTEPAHSAASYCLFIMVSPDGGFTWWLYGILYDPSGRDLINPKMAVDITGTDDRFYIAYEYCYSSTDHDVYVYGETSVLDNPGAPPNPQDIGVGTSTSMEQNPAVASDYVTTETSYRVAAFEYAYSSTDYDIRASQSTGSGSTWTTAVDVAATSAMETNPALTAGCTGNDPYTAYMHLAYNYDTYTSSATNLLSNPGFESGNNGYWTVRVSGDISCSGTNTHTGTCKAWLGGVVSQPNDWIYQQVVVPAGSTSAQFSFWLKIVSAETVLTPHDYFYAEVRDSSGAVLQTLVTLSDVDETAYASYVQLTFDLSPYKGRTIRVHFWASNDGANITSFYVDDTSLSIAKYNTASEVRYANAVHPGGTSYPSGLASATKVTVLANAGGTTAWPYGPPAIAATHGGSKTVSGSRIVVAADQYFPQDQPTTGDPPRYQLTFAVNMCNGGTTCGNISGCSPTLSLNWNDYYFYDNEADYRFPALVVDGVGWVQGDSPYGQNDVAIFPEVFMSYYYRPFDFVSSYGAAQMLVAFASDETCTGFADGAWYLFTASTTASDDDNRVVPKQGTLALFNYFFGWPGICFNKNLYHPGASYNDDAYFTTLGDNYTVDTTSSGLHIDGYWWFYGESQIGPWTYAWPAGFTWTLTAEPSALDDGRYYAFTGWSTGETSLEGHVYSDWCGYGGGCASTNVYAYFGGGCLMEQSQVLGVLLSKQTGNKAVLAWSPPPQPGDVGQYAIYRATNASSAGQYSLIGSSATTTYTDTTASGPLYYYIVVAQCGPYSGPWGHYGQ